MHNKLQQETSFLKKVIEQNQKQTQNNLVIQKSMKMEKESIFGLNLKLYASNFTLLLLLLVLTPSAIAWTGEIKGRVVCDVCGDTSIGPEDHVLQGAEVAVLCITKSGEVVNYQAFTDSKGVYTVAETMSESERWDACLARPISSFHERCNHLGDGSTGVKFTYKRPSGYSYTLKPFVYQFADSPMYC